MDDAGTILLVLFGLFCVLPLVLFAAALGVVVWRIRRMARTDMPALEKQFEKLQAENPKLNHDQVLKLLIRQQATRCGIIGALTGLGGFFTLLIGLPLDVLLTARIQAGTVQFIAQRYGFSATSEAEVSQRAYLTLAGGSQMVRTTQRLVTGYLTRIAGKALAKSLPLVGFATGFAVNFAIAQASGQLALAYYSSRPERQPGGEPGQ